MKCLLFLSGFLAVSGSLSAQTLTLSGSTFYLGDAPGSYTLACPNGSSARVTALTKIADSPASLLPASPVTQAANGTVFQAATGNTGQQVFVSTLPQSATGVGFYNVGVLSGSYSCYAAQTGTAPVSFTITLAGISRANVQAQKTWALKASSVKLPQLTTTEQTSLPPQQAGNVVFNTDQQKLAVHNGTAWQYVSTNALEASQFQNEKAYINSTTWTVPTGVTRILAEVWGAGAGGPVHNYSGTALLASGGGAGGYARGFLTVTPGASLTITVGYGGSGDNRIINFTPTIGGNSILWSGNEYIRGDGGYIDGSIGGSGGQWLGSVGFGTQISSVNSGLLLYQSGDRTINQDGSNPGGGGGCGYNYGGNGGGGMIVIHW